MLSESETWSLDSNVWTPQMNCNAWKTELENPSFPSFFMLLAVIKWGGVFINCCQVIFAFVFTRLHEARSGDICNACVLLVKRWKKLPAGSKKNWNHVSHLFFLYPKTNSSLPLVHLAREGRCWQGFGVCYSPPHSPFPPSASQNPSWSISCYMALICLRLAYMRVVIMQGQDGVTD